MLSGRIVRASRLRPAAVAGWALATRRLPAIQQRSFFPPSINSKEVIEEKYPAPVELTDAEDPEMNGGYVNPPRIKRQFRDPHADWWDKQERRNYGEPVHEDHDLLGMFTPYEYTWITPGKGLLQIGLVVAAFLSVIGLVKLNMPEYPVYPREFEGGLERELGGPGAVRARAPGDPYEPE